MGMATKKIEVSQQEHEHLIKLRKHPEIKARFEAILSICDEGQDQIQKADEVEKRLIEETRKLGNTMMLEWGTTSEKRSAEQYLKNHPGSYCGKKKD